MIENHLYKKARRERGQLKGLVKWIRKELDDVPMTVVATHPMWIIDSESYDELASKIMGAIDDALEEIS